MQIRKPQVYKYKNISTHPILSDQRITGQAEVKLRAFLGDYDGSQSKYDSGV
jgi:hypothetical protein